MTVHRVQMTDDDNDDAQCHLSGVKCVMEWFRLHCHCVCAYHCRGACRWCVVEEFSCTRSLHRLDRQGCSCRVSVSSSIASNITIITIKGIRSPPPQLRLQHPVTPPPSDVIARISHLYFASQMTFSYSPTCPRESGGDGVFLKQVWIFLPMIGCIEWTIRIATLAKRSRIFVAKAE